MLVLSVRMLKITGGQFKGQSIVTPPGFQARPTLARVREAIFNSLQSEVPEARVLDCFAGSGALGFEAMSREASSVLFVESSKRSVACLEKTIQKLKLQSKTQIISKPIERVTSLLTQKGPFDLVFADPPYDSELAHWILKEFPWDDCLSPDGILVLETRQQNGLFADQIGCLAKVREKKYGDTLVTQFKRQGSSAAEDDS